MRAKPTTYIYAEVDHPETGEQSDAVRYTIHSLDEFFTHVTTVSVPRASLRETLELYKGHTIRTCVRPGDMTALNILMEGRRDNALQVCSPFVFTAEELTSGTALYQMRHLNVEAAFGGWQCLHPLDRALMQIEPRGGKPHPLLRWLRAMSPSLPEDLLYQFTRMVGHPGWFVTRQDPTGGEGVADYLRLGYSRGSSRAVQHRGVGALNFLKQFEKHYLDNTGENEVLFTEATGSSIRLVAKMAARKFCRIVSACWLELSYVARHNWPDGTFYRPEDYFNKAILERYHANARRHNECSQKPC